jgi:hypothetical protein
MKYDIEKYKALNDLMDKNASVRSLLWNKQIEYCDSTKAAISLGLRNRIGAICDEQCQFLCGASREFLKLASDAEESAKKYPDYRPLLDNIAQDMKECSELFINCYKRLEYFQRRGILPTSIPDISSLLDSSANNKP